MKYYSSWWKWCSYSMLFYPSTGCNWRVVVMEFWVTQLLIIAGIHNINFLFSYKNDWDNRKVIVTFDCDGTLTHFSSIPPHKTCAAKYHLALLQALQKQLRLRDKRHHNIPYILPPKMHFFLLKKSHKSPCVWTPESQRLLIKSATITW